MNQCLKEKEIYLCKFSEKREWLEQLSCGHIYTHSVGYYRDLEGSTIINNDFLDLIRSDSDNWYEYFNKFGDFVGIFSVYELVEKIKEIPSIRYGKVKYFSDESIDIIKIFNNIYEETCFYKRKNPFAIENEYRVALYGAYDDPFIVETTQFKQFEIFTFDEFFEKKLSN